MFSWFYSKAAGLVSPALINCLHEAFILTYHISYWEQSGLNLHEFACVDRSCEVAAGAAQSETCSRCAIFSSVFTLRVLKRNVTGCTFVSLSPPPIVRLLFCFRDSREVQPPQQSPCCCVYLVNCTCLHGVQALITLRHRIIIQNSPVHKDPF